MCQKDGFKSLHKPSLLNKGRRASSQSTEERHHFGTRSPKYTSAPGTPRSASTDSLVSLENGTGEAVSLDKLRRAMLRELRLTRKRHDFFLASDPQESEDEDVDSKTQPNKMRGRPKKAENQTAAKKELKDVSVVTDDFVAPVKEQKFDLKPHTAAHRGRLPFRRRATTENYRSNPRSTSGKRRDISEKIMSEGGIPGNMGKPMLANIVVNDRKEH
ncbi:hypothetical protein SCHPADRAFT_945917 [Schizopora paradoxa]|uniref:Uncharacterized protein n=1 Tax=Schizopora paradoxa TaxID=27342 RepID=A0A0H2R5P8_9AGAM|nr:hypothetical protein SCHPADRAFT_945917 [Schizopora paradoxa]